MSRKKQQTKTKQQRQQQQQQKKTTNDPFDVNILSSKKYRTREKNQNANGKKSVTKTEIQSILCNKTLTGIHIYLYIFITIHLLNHHSSC